MSILDVGAMYEVYGLRDFQPYALACKACAEQTTASVRGAYMVLEPAAPRACELVYEGVCTENSIVL